MSNVFTLDSIREAAEAKYGSTDIDLGNGQVLVMLNPLRLPKAKRDALEAIQEGMDADDADHESSLREAIRLVASNPAMADKFLEIIGDDLAMLATVFERYTEGAQVGEASASQD